MSHHPNAIVSRSRGVPCAALRLALIALAAWPAGGLCGGCAKPPPYGTEQGLTFPLPERQVWAVAPAVNLSGQREVDPLLQADLLYQQLQEVSGLTVIPVNRVVEVYVGLGIEQVESAEQAVGVCDLLGCDALVVPTVTAYDPYDPPKFGGSLQVFTSAGRAGQERAIDVRDLARAAAPGEMQPLAQPRDAGFRQVVGMYDAANGSVRDALFGYARGRHDPTGPMGQREYLQSMDRYIGFAYHTLIADLLRELGRTRPM